MIQRLQGISITITVSTTPTIVTIVPSNAAVFLRHTIFPAKSLRALFSLLLLLLLLMSKEATAVGEPSRAEQILKPSQPIGGSILPPQKTSRAEPTFKSRLLMGEFSPLQASRGSPVS